MSAKYNITIHANADFTQTLTVRDPEGNLANLTGHTQFAQLREYPEAIDHFDFTVTNNGADGQILIEMSSDLTGKIGFSQGAWDLFDHYNGQVVKLIYGTANIIPAVTH